MVTSILHRPTSRNSGHPEADEKVILPHERGKPRAHRPEAVRANAKPVGGVCAAAAAHAGPSGPGPGAPRRRQGGAADV